MTLIIISTPPTLDLEPIELILALAAFDQSPSLLLLGQGIHYANTLQLAKRSGGKSPSKVLAALPMYDCEEIFISATDITEQGFNIKDLHSHCTLINDDRIKQLINQAKHCVNF
jgi:tRNA 2-thiouridine synthesizing protein C